MNIVSFHLRGTLPQSPRCTHIVLACVLALGMGAAVAQDVASRDIARQGEIDELIGIILTRNPSILAATSDARSATEDVNAARWMRYPSFSVQAERRAAGGAVSGGAGMNGTVALTQPLWMISGSIPAQIEGAEATAAARQARVDEVRYQAAERAVDAWRGAVGAFAKAKAVTRALTRLKEFQAMMHRRVDAQVSPAIELDLVSSRVYQAQSDIANAQAAQRQFLSRLEQLTGQPVPPEALVEIANTLEERSLKAAGELAAGSDLQFAQWVERHPSMRKAAYELQAVKAQLKAKEAERWPQAYVKLQRTSSPGVEKADMGVFVGLSYTPGAGFSSMDQARSAMARAESAEATIEVQRRDTFGAFQSDWSDLQNYRERQQTLALARGDARTVLQSYERLFIAGRRSWLDVLTAVREVQQNEEALADARIGHISAAQRILLRAGEKPWQREITQ